MYEKNGCILIGSSASAIDNNLGFCREDDTCRAVVVHKSTVNLISWNDSKQQRLQIFCKTDSGNKLFVIQAQFVKCQATVYLVVINTESIIIYSKDGLEICSLPYSQYTNDSILKAMCALPGNRLAFGTHSGNILILSLESQNLKVLDNLETDHRGSITVMTSNDSAFISGGEDGRMFLRKAQPSYSIVLSFDGYGFPCTGIAITSEKVVVAYGSGHLRLFNIKNSRILAEITAHAKWITGLDLAESSNMVLSTSEDSFVRVWQLLDSPDNPIVLKFSESICDVRLFGGRFVDGKSFALVGYEQEEIMCYSM